MEEVEVVVVREWHSTAASEPAQERLDDGRRRHAGDVAAQARDLAHERTGDERQTRIGHEEHGVEVGVLVAVAERELRFVVELAAAPHAAHDRAAAECTSGVDDEPAHDFDAHVAPTARAARRKRQRDALLHGEERLLRGVRGDRHDDFVEANARAREHVEMAERDRIERARKEGAAGVESGHEREEDSGGRASACLANGAARHRAARAAVTARIPQPIRALFGAPPDTARGAAHLSGMENRVEQRHAAPPRPCLVLAAVVGSAALAGRALPAAAVCLAVVTAAGALGVWLVRRARRASERPSRPPAAAWFALAGLAALVLGARASNVEEVPLGHTAIEGTWRRLPFERGRLELDDGRVVAADLMARVAPPDGERVVLLPPFVCRESARGPVFDGTARTRVALEADQVVRLGVVAGASEPTLLARLRTELARRSHALPDPGGAPPSGLAAALFVNDRSQVDGEVSDLFKRTGTLHLLAISGMHVVLFAWLVAWPLRRGVRVLLMRLHVPRPWPRRCGALAAGATIVVFSALAGGEAPIVRAAVATVVVLLVRDWPREEPRTTDTLALLALGLALELVADPLALENVGLVLSYGACLGLALGARPASQAVSLLVFGRALEREVDPLVWIGSRPRLVAAILALRARRAIAWGLGSSIAATFGTLPTQWSVFGEFSPVGIVATPLVGPLMVPWLPALWVGALDPQGPIAWPQAWIESLALWLLALCDALPGTSLILPERPVWWIFGVSALALAALAVARRGDRQRHCERAACAGLALTLVPWTCAPRELEVFALDVGHGTCVVARAPGLPLVVFDAGTTTRHGLERSALRPLLSRFDAGAGLLVVSHLDRDHSAAVPWLARRGLFARTAGAWPADLTHDAPHVDIATTPGAFEGETRAGAGARTDAARWRLTRGSLERGNEGSRNLELTWNGARVLLCGDATGEGFARLVDERVTRGSFDLVLLPHHGRHGVGTQRLLDELAPREVWLSSETPAPILSELERRGVPWRGTFATGPLGPWRAHDPPPRPLPLVTTAVRSASRTTRERRPRRDVKNSATHTSVRSARGLDERPTRRTRHTRRRCRSLASTTAHAPR